LAYFALGGGEKEKKQQELKKLLVARG